MSGELAEAELINDKHLKIGQVKDVGSTSRKYGTYNKIPFPTGSAQKSGVPSRILLKILSARQDVFT